MRIRDIKKGKKYLQVVEKRGYNRTSKQPPAVELTIYVLDVDPVKNLVCASVGGAPAQWVDSKKYTHWQKVKKEVSNA